MHGRKLTFKEVNKGKTAILILTVYRFIHKMMQSDWLDSGTWTIYTFPYRRSGPFIQLSIKVKTQDFWEDGR